MTDEDARRERVDDVEVAGLTADDLALINWDQDERPAQIRAIVARIVPGWRQKVFIGQGWWPLLVRLDQRLARLDPDYDIVQVKEKFGGLRFYAAPSNGAARSPAFNAAIRDAEIEASRTCETCGQPGRLHSRKGWVVTLCAEHAAAVGAKPVG